LLIVDRKKEIIVSGGENISSLELRKPSLLIPPLEAGVIPFPIKWGEVPKVWWYKPNAPTRGELIEFCLRTSHITSAGSSDLISLPKTGTGKILKKDLARILAGRIRFARILPVPGAAAGRFDLAGHRRFVRTSTTQFW